MKLKKVEDGLLEHNNYFIETPIGDFLGDFYCDRFDGEFYLYEGYVERPFPYDEYVLVIEKEVEELQHTDILRMYTRANSKVYGIMELGYEEGDLKEQWRISKYNGFIQGYTKNKDDIDWLNVGGADTEQFTDIQGFAIEGDTPLKIKDYKVYSSPYLYIYQVPQGYSAEVVDEENNIVFEKRYADESGQIALYVTNITRGYLILYDRDGKEVERTDSMRFKYGDRFIYGYHDIVMKYRGRILDIEPTFLNQRKELVELQNISNTNPYERLLVTVFNENIDKIAISLDNQNFDQYVRIDKLEPQESINIYVQITRSPSNQGFCMRKFALEVDEY